MEKKKRFPEFDDLAVGDLFVIYEVFGGRFGMMFWHEEKQVNHNLYKKTSDSTAENLSEPDPALKTSHFTSHSTWVIAVKSVVGLQ
ncbi:MAG: hypothetical protein Athens071425_404 [Parcubacteria group bacterium Athens0714_25]|nr:MAG: hypothetical protein Athens071425_404 [Parcubacteria group bacterium Athens0714_25]